jgi:peptide deformylase
MHEQIAKKVGLFSLLLKEVPEMKYLGDPVLRTPTQDVSVEIGKEIGEKLGEVLLKLRKIAGYGRGLAAPQIGESQSVFVTFVGDKLQTYINPKIINRSEETNFYKELCLSSGIMSADIERPESITMEWTDEKGEKHNEKFDSFMARLLQHEEAHLRGVPNIDEAGPGDVEIFIGNPLDEKLRKNKT